MAGGWLVWSAELLVRECGWSCVVGSGVSLEGEITRSGFDVPANCVL